jgi:hypothetical protein
LWVAHQYPTYHDRVKPGFIPHTRLSIELHFPRPAILILAFPWVRNC